MTTHVQIRDVPFYQPKADECAVFETAHAAGRPLLLKGPTGCGKTRFVEHMAARLNLPLYTIACHDDLSAADLIGRYLLKGGATGWAGGPPPPPPPLHPLPGHHDLSAADLIGRYLLKGGETVWADGPLPRAGREGGICYL